MHEKLLDMFQDLLDVCYEDERTNSDDHYGIEDFVDTDLAEKFEAKLDEAMDYLAHYDDDVYDEVKESLDSGVSYETCIETALDLLVKL